MSATEATTTATVTATTNKSKQSDAASAKNTDSGANFRRSQPIQPTSQTDSTPNTDASTKKKGKVNELDANAVSRFGMAGKPAAKISFRILTLTDIKLSFKPYAYAYAAMAMANAKKKEFCIKPGGINGAIKPFTSSSGRKQFKKVGIRISYSIKQLLSIRQKFNSFPSDLAPIPKVLVEGLGNFETLTSQTITTTTTDKISPSKLRKSAASATTITTSTSTTTTTTTTTTTATASAPSYGQSASTRYEGNDDDASFRKRKTVTPSKIIVSKLKKRETNHTIIPSTETPEQKETKPLSLPLKRSVHKAQTKSYTVPESSYSDKPTPIKHKPIQPIHQNSQRQSSKPLSLFKSKSAWGRGRKILDPMAQFTAKITVRLNKITMDNFSTLSDQLIAIFDGDISNTEQLTKLVTLIFEKTVQEHVYGPLYAKLCVALSAKNKSFDEIMFGASGKKEIKQVDFKNVLVKVCQKEFKRGKRAIVFRDEMDATDRENEEIKQKKILLGTMKFIGQLYLKQLIPCKIMLVCLARLVYSGKPSEDEIEGACTLLKTVGEAMDEDDNVNKNELSKYYQKLKSIERNSKYKVRIRMLIQNLLDLRKNNWTDKNQAPKKKAASKPKESLSTQPLDVYEYDPFISFDMSMDNGADVTNDMITGGTVPLSGHVVGQSQRKLKYKSKNRYNEANESKISVARDPDPSRKKVRQQLYQVRSGEDRKKKGRKLLEIEDEEEEDNYNYNYNNNNMREESDNVEITEEAKGKPKRVTLSLDSARPCDSGKPLTDELFDDLSGDLLYNRNDMTTDKFLESIVKYNMGDGKQRSKFVLQFIQKAVDGSRGEKLSSVFGTLLNEYILLPSELDSGFIAFFKGYTFEDNPLLSLSTSQLVAPLIVDQELNFSQVLEWILLDTFENQPKDEFLKFYEGDGIRNYIKKSKTITKAMELLAYLFKELKEANFEDSQYVNKLIVGYDFKIGPFLNQEDVQNEDAIQTEWISKYGLQFAF